MPKCHLCGFSNKKMAKAHIVPKSLYGWKRANGWDVDGVLASADRTQKIKRAPIGAYDKEILCSECEARLSSLDGEAAKALLHEVPKTILEDGGEPLVFEFQDTPSEELLTFFGFLLWRMSVTSHCLFKHVRLGKYERLLREALGATTPSSIPQLDVFVQKFDRALNPVMSPTRLRISGINGYRVTFPGYSCWVKIDNRPFPDEFLQVALSAGGKFRAVSANFQSSPEYKAAIHLLKERPDLEKLNFGKWKIRNRET